MVSSFFLFNLAFMFNTKNLVLEESDIPSYWVFQYYLNLPEKLTGQDIKLTSVFNPNEKTPSFCIYVDKNINQYKFKDFSTGKNGNKVDLVKLMFNLEYPAAAMRIVKDYNLHVKTEGFEEINFKPEAKWEVDFVKVRPWNQDDSKFWLSFRIGMSILTEYNVKPIEYYNLVKSEADQVKALKIEGTGLYGYFDKSGDIYKVYQPKSSKHKFHKVKPHLQGYDQLKFNQPYLVICSSLKDALCGFSFNMKYIDGRNFQINNGEGNIIVPGFKKIIPNMGMKRDDNIGNLIIEFTRNGRFFSDSIIRGFCVSIF